MSKQNQDIQLISDILPAEIVLSPAWWHKHASITFDEDFFYHPARRVEAERQMEQVLYQRWGKFGLGADRDKDLPQVGAVHLAAGFLISEMLGCEVQYCADKPPQVVPAEMEQLDIDIDQAFASPAYKRFCLLTESLKKKYGYLTGDVNWAGVLNLAMDLRGERIFMDFFDKPARTGEFLLKIRDVISKFVLDIRSAHTP